MKFQKLESTDAFVVRDLEAAHTAVGIARLAPKVLRDGAELLARSTTYAFAAFGVEGHTGASAGVNAKPDDRDAAIAAFVSELTASSDGDGALHLQPGVGLTAADLGPLGFEPDPAALATGAAAAADSVLGGLGGSRAVVHGAHPELLDAMRQALGKHNAADVAEGEITAACDVLFVAGKAGIVDHELAEGIDARGIVPLTPVPVTARGYAVLRKADKVYVPDFVSTAGPLLQRFGGVIDPDEQIATLARELASAGAGAFLVAVGLAEAFLASWQDETPFGRPLA